MYLENIFGAFLEFIRTDSFLIILLGAIVILLILYITSIIKMHRIRKEYKKFIEKLGNGVNIEEILEKHINRINEAINKNKELENLCVKIDSDIKNCVQKIRNIQI